MILDTNVISEPLKKNSSPLVTQWLDEQASSTLYLTAINLAELLMGLELLPTGRRKDTLRKSLLSILARHIGTRTLPFDDDAARAYSSLASRARKNGVAVSLADAQIAAIASVHRLTVATRDEAPFQAMGIEVINPWRSA